MEWTDRQQGSLKGPQRHKEEAKATPLAVLEEGAGFPSGAGVVFCSPRPFATPQKMKLTHIRDCLPSQPWGVQGVVTDFPMQRSLIKICWIQDAPASLLRKRGPHGYPASCLHRENFLVLDVFFEALTSEAIEQRAAYGLSALLGETGVPLSLCVGGSTRPLPLTLLSCFPGDLGGQMGLFIGASILTLLEILDYIYEARAPGRQGGSGGHGQSRSGQCGVPGGAGLAGKSGSGFSARVP